MSAGPARIAPGTARQVGLQNNMLAFAASRSAGADRRLAVFMTLGRHRRLFRAWVRLSRQLLRRGELPLIDTELLILRVARNCRSEYEWQQHQRMAESAGLAPQLIDRIAGASLDSGFEPRQAALLRAAANPIFGPKGPVKSRGAFSFALAPSPRPRQLRDPPIVIP